MLIDERRMDSRLRGMTVLTRLVRTKTNKNGVML